MKEALKTAIECLKIFNDNSNGDPTYAHAIKVFEALAQPAQEQQSCDRRTWVGLTDEEIGECYEATYEYGMSMNDLPQVIEAKLKEKNNGLL